MAKKIMLLGSGELGKEFVIAAQRLGQTVVACDSYAGAPAMQVADACEVFPMLDGDALAAAVARHRPDVIVPEIEAIRTERLYDFEREGIQVVPSARAVNFTMNRKAIRDLAARELGLKTARYFYATSLAELEEAAARIGFPCVVKPLMSSSGKGQSLVRNAGELERAWHYGCEGSRGDIRELDHRGIHPLRQRNHAADRQHAADRHALFARRSAMCRRAATTARVSSRPTWHRNTSLRRSAWRPPSPKP